MRTYFVASRAPLTVFWGNSRLRLPPLLITETVTVTVEVDGKDGVVGSDITPEVAAAVIEGTVVLAVDIVELA